MQNGIKKEHRFTKLETIQDNILKDIKAIKENHLPHIEGKLDKLIWSMLAGFASLVTALVILILKS